MLKYIYTGQQSLSMVDLMTRTVMLPYNENQFFWCFFSNFKHVMIVLLKTYDIDSCSGNF